MTPRQERFVAEYLIDLNATQAAIRAGYSAKTAEHQGPRLLGYAQVVEAVKAAKEKRSERVEITQDHALEVLREAIERTRKGENETALARFLALEMRHLGMLRDKIEHSGPGGEALTFTLKLDGAGRESDV